MGAVFWVSSVNQALSVLVSVRPSGCSYRSPTWKSSKKRPRQPSTGCFLPPSRGEVPRRGGGGLWSDSIGDLQVTRTSLGFHQLDQGVAELQVAAVRPMDRRDDAPRGVVRAEAKAGQAR